MAHIRNGFRAINVRVVHGNVCYINEKLDKIECGSICECDQALLRTSKGESLTSQLEEGASLYLKAEDSGTSHTRQFRLHNWVRD
jgi:hypothetical protein